jgi:ribulose 1,5-bisphosphate synthetase/thiazole synthase
MKLVKLNVRKMSQNFKNNEKIIHTDVLIVGSGAAGASLACALSLSPHFNKVNNQY